VFKSVICPRIGKIGEIAGTINKSVAAELNIPTATKIVIGTHDQIVADIGAGALLPGSAVIGSGSVESIIQYLIKWLNPQSFIKTIMLKSRC